MRIFHYIGFAFIIVLVSACGGGGGGGDDGGTPPPPVKPPPPPPPPFFSGVELGSLYGSLGTIADITHDQPTLTTDITDAEKDAFRNEAQYSGQAALEMIHASAAYARLKKANKGAPGNGITLGMIDDGIDHSIAELKANIDEDSWLGILLNAADITAIEAGIGTISPADIAFTLTGIQKQVNVITNQPSLSPQDSCIRSVADFLRGHQFCLVALADGSYMLLRPAENGNNHGTSVASIMVGIKDDETDATAEPENDIYGLSYDAKLYVTPLILTAFDGDRPDFSDPTLYAMDDRFLTQAVNNQLAKNPVAVNMSVVEIGNGDIFFTGDDATRTALITGIRSSFNGFITALAQASKPKAERVIFVLAAGNDGRDHPGYFSAMQSYITELEGHMLTVVAVNLNEPPNARDGLSDEELRRLLLRYGRQGEPGEIADFSNGCGIAKKWCLAAPGRDIYRLDAPPSHPAPEAFKDGQGTSFAAPLVTSALGLLKQWWPQLGNDELVLRLLKTADRSGVYANSDIYGWGLLDLDAATRPAGATSMQMGAIIGEQGVPSAQSFMEIAPPLAGLQAGFQGKTIALFDELDTPFFAYMDSFTAPLHPNMGGVALQSALGHFMGSDIIARPKSGQGLYLLGGSVKQADLPPLMLVGDKGGKYDMKLSFGYRAHPAMLSGGTIGSGFSRKDSFLPPFLALAQQGVSGAMQMKLGGTILDLIGFSGSPYWQELDGITRQSADKAHGFMLALRPEKNPLQFQMGAVSETSTWLGSRNQGAFQAGKGHMTWFGGLHMKERLGKGWHLHSSAWLGVTKAELSENSIITNITPLISSSFSLGVQRHGLWHKADMVSLRLTKPLQIEQGEMKLRYAIDRRVDKSLIYEQNTLSLVRDKQEMELEISYKRTLKDKGQFGISAAVIYAPHYAPYEDIEARILTYLRRSF